MDTPAFPVNSPSGSPEYIPQRDGMTLRDWLAGQALSGLTLDRSARTDADADAIAEMAYRLADAMIRRRASV